MVIIKVPANGIPRRLATQLNKLNKLEPGRYTGKVIGTHSKRAAGLFHEKYITSVYRTTMENLPRGMKSPSGIWGKWFKF